MLSLLNYQRYAFRCTTGVEQVIGSSRGNRNFRLLWSGVGLNAAGESVIEVAIPLIAVLEFSATSFQVATLMAVEQISWLLLGLSAGVIIDRYPKKRVLVFGTGIRAAIYLSIPVAAYFHVLSLGQLFAVAAVSGVLFVFSSVAQEAIVPSIVERATLIDANSRLASTVTTVDLAAKALATPLVQFVGGPLTTLIGFAGALGTSLTWAGVKEPPLPRTERKNFIAEVWEGLQFTFGEPIFRALTIATTLSNFFTAAQAALLIVFLVRTIELPLAAVGSVLAAASVGGLMGALSVGRLTKKLNSGPVFRLALLIGPIFGLLIPFAGNNLALVCFVFGTAGLSAGLAIVNIIGGSARQAICPPRLIGRLSASSMFVTWGVIPVGLLVGGTLGGLLGNRLALAVIAVGFFSGLLVVAVSPLRKIVRLEDATIDVSAAPAEQEN